MSGETTLEVLERLIAFPTLSRRPNRDLLDYLIRLLEAAGARCEVFAHPEGERANLFVTIGPPGPGGVVLSGHTDVVPVEGQAWSSDPFRLRLAEGRYYGRGTADMKGFVASAVSCALRASQLKLKTPLHLALSYDEEIGCVGVRDMIAGLERRADRPAFCIVGEPTSLRVATGHKGKTALRACCHGKAAHSALAPRALNALHLGAAFVTGLQGLQTEIAEHGPQDEAYDVPYSTLHVGIMSGGRALNIVPDLCVIDFELRNLARVDPAETLARVSALAEGIVSPLRARFPEARLEIETLNAYPGLDTPPRASVVDFLRGLGAAAEAPCQVAFGTEGGLFHQRLGVEVAICGPGDMEQGHKPDEFVTADQLSRCDALMDRLIARLQAGI